jgi:hypothetical protein
MIKMNVISTISNKIAFALVCASMLNIMSCSQHRCAANGGGYVDKPGKAKRTSHAKSGLFPGYMKK